MLQKKVNYSNDIFYERVKKKNNKSLLKNLFFFSKYYLVFFVFLFYGLIATTLNNFQLKLVDESILKYDNDLNGVTGEIYFQDIVVPSNNQNLEIIKENLEVFAEINYTHLFVKSNEGFLSMNKK